MTGRTGGFILDACYSEHAAGPPAQLSEPLVHYIVVREDLPRGLQAAQITHAAGESSPGNLSAGTHAVVLGVRDTASLEEVARRLARAGVAHVRIEEPDPPWDGALLAIGLVPGRKEVLRRHVSSLRLLR